MTMSGSNSLAGWGSWALRPERLLAYPDAPAHARLVALLAATLWLVYISFGLENQFTPWSQRMDQFSPGWAWASSQAVASGVAIALAVRGGWFSVAQGLLGATLLAYAYVLGGLSLIETRRAFQAAVLVSRGANLGLAAACVLTAAVAARICLRQRLALRSEELDSHAKHFSLAELLFLTAACAVGLRIAQEFTFDVTRDHQFYYIAVTLVRTLPATLPWLWLLTLDRPTTRLFSAVAAISAIVFVVKFALAATVASDPPIQVLLQIALTSLACTLCAVLNGLLLRCLGFRWRRG
jgi:hypothetical protein